MGQKDLPAQAVGQEDLPDETAGQKDLPGGAVCQEDPREAASPAQRTVVVVDVPGLGVHKVVEIIAVGEHALVSPRHQLGEAGATRGGPDVGQVPWCHVSHVALVRLVEELEESLVVAARLPVHVKHSPQGRQLRKVHLSPNSTCSRKRRKATGNGCAGYVAIESSILKFTSFFF